MISPSLPILDSHLFFVDQLFDSAVVDVCSHVSKNMAPLWMVNLCESLNKKRDTMDVKICVFNG
jgi:hypothetical protein